MNRIPDATLGIDVAFGFRPITRVRKQPNIPMNRESRRGSTVSEACWEAAAAGATMIATNGWPARPGAKGATMSRNGEPLEAGQKIRDIQTDTVGEIVEYACQYAHPKADPVYSYLVRWEDGQVNALSESAFNGSHGYEIID